MDSRAPFGDFGLGRFCCGASPSEAEGGASHLGVDQNAPYHGNHQKDGISQAHYMEKGTHDLGATNIDHPHFMIFEFYEIPPPPPQRVLGRYGKEDLALR